MSEKTEPWTQAAWDADEGMKVVDGLISFISDTRGKPSTKQRALYVAAVTFSYAVWENYIEDLAIELVERMSPVITPERLPQGLVERINRDLTAGELSVAPGWRQVWVERTRLAAKGDDSRIHGLSMARPRQVEHLFGWVGFSPFNGLAPSLTELDRLIDLRNAAVHTGKIPDDLRKADVIQWREFVHNLYCSIDKGCRGMAANLHGHDLY